jgi:mannose-6-phosphate isomerase-like protein (cupin superfamily)
MILSELRKGEKMEKKYVFRNIEDAPAYDVSNCEGGLGTIKNITLFGDEAQMPVVGPRNPEDNSNFHYVHRTTLPVGMSVGEHPHEGNEQFYLIIEGEGEVTLCGEQFPVKPWSIALIRSGGSHGIRNTGDVPLVYICVETGLAQK